MFALLTMHKCLFNPNTTTHSFSNPYNIPLLTASTHLTNKGNQIDLSPCFNRLDVSVLSIQCCAAIFKGTVAILATAILLDILVSTTMVYHVNRAMILIIANRTNHTINNRECSTSLYVGMD